MSRNSSSSKALKQIWPSSDHHHRHTANKPGLASFLPQIKEQSFEHNGEDQPNEIINHSLNPAHKW